MLYNCDHCGKVVHPELMITCEDCESTFHEECFDGQALCHCCGSYVCKECWNERGKVLSESSATPTDEAN